MNNLEQLENKLETELQLAKDRMFIYKYYKMEEEIESLNNQIHNLKSKNEELASALKQGLSLDVTKSLYEIEKDAILAAMKTYKDVRKSADVLGITMKQLYNKMHQYNINNTLEVVK